MLHFLSALIQSILIVLLMIPIGIALVGLLLVRVMIAAYQDWRGHA